MKLNNKTRKNIRSIGKAIPHILFYLLAVALLLASIYVVVLLLKEVLPNPTSENRIQLYVGLGTTLLSLVIGLTGIATFLTSSLINSKKEKYARIEKTNAFIKEFNQSIIDDLNIVTRTMNSTFAEFKWKCEFEPSLSDQKEVFNKFSEITKKHPATYKEVLCFNIATILIGENNVLNQDARDFSKTIIKNKMNTKNLYANTIGGTQLLYIFKRKRVAILNYFENLSICYINETIDTNLVDEQFKEILISTIPLLYYEIYRLEKLNSYPYLNKTLKIMQEK